MVKLVLASKPLAAMLASEHILRKQIRVFSLNVGCKIRIFSIPQIGTMDAAKFCSYTADAPEMVLQVVLASVLLSALLALVLERLVLDRVHVVNVLLQPGLVERLERTLLAHPLRLDSALVLQVVAQGMLHLVTPTASLADQSRARLGAGQMGLAPMRVQVSLAHGSVVAEAALECTVATFLARVLRAGRVSAIQLGASAALIHDVGAVTSAARTGHLAGHLWIGQVTARTVELQHGLDG